MKVEIQISLFSTFYSKKQKHNSCRPGLMRVYNTFVVDNTARRRWVFRDEKDNIQRYTPNMYICGRQPTTIFFCCVIKLCFVKHKYSWVSAWVYRNIVGRQSEERIMKIVKKTHTAQRSSCLSGAYCKPLVCTADSRLEWV